MNKFEKLIEYIINDEDQKARELFHDIVVEKSRDIYESIMDEEQVAERVHGDQVGDMVDEIGHDEEHTMEDDAEGEEFAVDGEEEVGAGDEEFSDEVASDEFGSEESEEDKIMNIDAKLDELLAKFDEIMGDEGSAEEVPAEEPAFGGEEEFGAEEQPEAFAEAKEGSAQSGKSGKSGNPFAKGSAQSGKSGSAKSGKSGKPFEGKQSSSELMREYVDRIGDIYGGAGDATEGDAVGSAGKKTSVNTKDVNGPGNNFGGTAVTSKGGAQDQDGTSPATAPKPQVSNAGNRNVPGAKADTLAKGPSAKSGEESAVNEKPVQVENTGKK